MKTTRFVTLKNYFAIITAIIFMFFGFGFSTKSYPPHPKNPQELVLRAEFYTSYPASSPERKSNIALAVSKINGYFLEVGGVFSFNKVVGDRTLDSGFKNAKIIVNGRFTDGVGGGICQVSTTLYNAVLLSGLKIIEYHPHSLVVSYIAPSFDAMVNSGGADLKFQNTTDNPIVICATANGSVLKISVLGEPMQEKYFRQSVVTETISAPDTEIIVDEKGEYPEILNGERKVFCYGKEGLKSLGYLIKHKNGKLVSVTQIRKDTYKPMRGLIVEGRALEIPEKN